MGGIGHSDGPLEGLQPNARGGDDEVPAVDMAFPGVVPVRESSGQFEDDSEKQSSKISSTISPHYNPDEDVVLRAEFISERLMKVRDVAGV